MIASLPTAISTLRLVRQLCGYKRNAGRRICIDLLSILSAEHAEVVAAMVAIGDNS
jgi:hypothetical protein